MNVNGLNNVTIDLSIVNIDVVVNNSIAHHVYENEFYFLQLFKVRNTAYFMYSVLLYEKLRQFSTTLEYVNSAKVEYETISIWL